MEKVLLPATTAEPLFAYEFRLFAQLQVSSVGSHSERCENWWASTLHPFPAHSASLVRNVSSLHHPASSWGSWSTTWRTKCAERYIRAAKNSWDYWRLGNCSIQRPDSRVERLIHWAMDTSMSYWHRSKECSICQRWLRSNAHRKPGIINRMMLFIRKIIETFYNQDNFINSKYQYSYCRYN